MRQHTRNAVGFVVLAILMAALFYWNINTGSVHLSLERMLTLLRWGNDGTTEGNLGHPEELLAVCRRRGHHDRGHCHHYLPPRGRGSAPLLL